MKGGSRDHCLQIERKRLKDLIAAGVLRREVRGPICDQEVYYWFIQADVRRATAEQLAEVDAETPAAPIQDLEALAAITRANAEDGEQPADPNEFASVEAVDTARVKMLESAAVAVLECQKLSDYIFANSLTSDAIMAILDKACGKRSVKPASAVSYFKSLEKKGGASVAAAA